MDTTLLTGQESTTDTMKKVPSSDLPVHSGSSRGIVTLVTGGAGFVGSNLCKALLQQGRIVYAVDNLITGRAENVAPFLDHKNFHFFELDINDTNFVEQFQNIQVNEVYHLACPTGVPNITILSTEMLDTCSLGTRNTLEVARMHKASLLFTSSCEVYGEPEVFPQTPEYTGNVSPVGPRCPYEEGKRFSESLVITYVRKYGLDAKIVRIFNTYGPGMSPEDQRVIPQFLKSIRLNKNLPVYGDGQQTRTFLYVDDLLRGFFLALHKGETGSVYNVGGNRQITMKELAELTIELTNSKSKVEYLPHFTEDHSRREPDTTMIRELGWEQTVRLEEGIKRMLTGAEKSPDYEMTTIKERSKVSA